VAIHFLFSADASEPNRPEELFADQWSALVRAGFTTSVCPDAVLAGAKLLHGVHPGSRVVYRGWMVKGEEYVALARAVERCGARMFTTAPEYLAAHHLPNWYPALADLTPETRIYPADADLVAELRALGWGEYFLKDYVKSLKAEPGPVVGDPAEAPAVLAAMREYRGEIEGGVCVRRVEAFLPGTERRYFVLGGVAYAASEDAPIPGLVRTCAARLSSPFFSVDIARRTDGELRVVEVGDGQVSDLVGWSAEAFAAMWLRGGLG